MAPPIAAIGIALVIVWAAAWVDVRTGRIPNALSVIGASLGVLVYLEHDGILGIAQSAAGLGVGFALMLPGYLLRSTGAGDVKLMAALGALMGPKGILLVFALAILTGALVGIGYALAAWWKQDATSPFKRYGRMLRFLMMTGRPTYEPPGPNEMMGQRFAFGVPIAIGTSAAVAGWLLQRY